MENKKLYIGLGLLAVGSLAFYLWKKNKYNDSVDKKSNDSSDKKSNVGGKLTAPEEPPCPPLCVCVGGNRTC